MKILLAVEAKKASDGAVRMAMAMQGQLDATVEVHTVLEVPPMVGEGVALRAFPADPDVQGHAASARDGIRDYLSSFGAPATEWPIQVEMGPVPHTIVRMAEEGGFTHIVLGQGRHKLVDRWLGSETALRVMQLSHLPVLAIPETSGALPSRIVVAVDLSDFSRRAVEQTLDICQPNSRLELVHVAWISPGDNQGFESASWHEELQKEMREELKDWMASIPRLSEFQTAVHVPAGTPADQVLKIAEEVGADLIAAGSHGHGFLGRTIFGSVSRELVRRAETQLLVVPPEEVADDVKEMSRGR